VKLPSATLNLFLPSGLVGEASVFAAAANIGSVGSSSSSAQIPSPGSRSASEASAGNAIGNCSGSSERRSLLIGQDEIPDFFHSGLVQGSLSGIFLS
jgi:hypothetical protein